MKILFVCLGNICRSPMAEFIAKNILKKHHIEGVSISSAGTSTEHIGQEMHYKTKAILNDHHLDCSGFKAKQINQKLFDESDYILVMDHSNYLDVIIEFKNDKKVIEIIKFANNKQYNEIPDPWYTNNFALVYMLLNEAINNFFKFIKIIN